MAQKRKKFGPLDKDFFWLFAALVRVPLQKARHNSAVNINSKTDEICPRPKLRSFY